MKRRKILFPGVGLCVMAALMFYLSTAHSQTTSRVVATGSTAKTAGGANPVAGSALFARAAGENARSQNTLRWTFGGKQQVGWEIYVPLIAHTIGTGAGPGSAEFARSLSKWQAGAGLTETGVLDEQALEAFVRYWQSRRLGRSALEGKLLAAPIVEFYDPTRSPDLLQLEEQTYAAYRKMIAAAARDLGRELKVTTKGELAPGERFLRIVSAYRSPEYQASLRKQQPNAGRAALARNSPHSTGHALDIYVGGDPVSTKDANRAIQVRTPAYKWLVKNAHRFGFYPYFYEPWHWEYVPGR